MNKRHYTRIPVNCRIRVGRDTLGSPLFSTQDVADGGENENRRAQLRIAHFKVAPYPFPRYYVVCTHPPRLRSCLSLSPSNRR